MYVAGSDIVDDIIQCVKTTDIEERTILLLIGRSVIGLVSHFGPVIVKC